MHQFYLLRLLCSKHKSDRKIVSVREYWDDALTAVCYNPPNSSAKQLGCGKCWGCFNRFSQVLHLIKSSSGVNDKVCVLHWGAVYRTDKYMNYFLHDWAMIDPNKYAAIAKATSC
jgi:hypothetical protein